MESSYEVVEGRLEVRGWKECFTPEALKEIRAQDKEEATEATE